MSEKKQLFTARNVALLGILTALMVLLQMPFASIHVGPTSFNLALVPIVLGAILLGPVGGGILGFINGVVALICGAVGLDGFTFYLLGLQPVGTVAICLVKTTVAGLGAGLLYRAIAGKHRYVAAFAASAITPVLNTGIFIIGALLMSGTIESYMASVGLEGVSVAYFVIIGCAGINFIVEFIVNLIVSPAIYRVVEVIKKRT